MKKNEAKPHVTLKNEIFLSGNRILLRPYLNLYQATLKIKNIEQYINSGTHVFVDL